MLFNSFAFLIFLPVFLLLYFNTRGNVRLWICLLGSYVFYGVCAVISFFLVQKFIVETKGKELEEMQG